MYVLKNTDRSEKYLYITSQSTVKEFGDTTFGLIHVDIKVQFFVVMLGLLRTSEHACRII
jgi:hypothetical protein